MATAGVQHQAREVLPGPRPTGPNPSADAAGAEHHTGILSDLGGSHPTRQVSQLIAHFELRDTPVAPSGDAGLLFAFEDAPPLAKDVSACPGAGDNSSLVSEAPAGADGKAELLGYALLP